jgi:hypothetical protein
MDGADQCRLVGSCRIGKRSMVTFLQLKNRQGKPIVISGFDIVTCYFDRRKSCGVNEGRRLHQVQFKHVRRDLVGFENDPTRRDLMQPACG